MGRDRGINQALSKNSGPKPCPGSVCMISAARSFAQVLSLISRRDLAKDPGSLLAADLPIPAEPHYANHGKRKSCRGSVVRWMRPQAQVNVVGTCFPAGSMAPGGVCEGGFWQAGIFSPRGWNAPRRGAVQPRASEAQRSVALGAGAPNHGALKGRSRLAKPLRPFRAPLPTHRLPRASLTLCVACLPAGRLCPGLAA